MQIVFQNLDFRTMTSLNLNSASSRKSNNFSTGKLDFSNNPAA